MAVLVGKEQKNTVAALIKDYGNYCLKLANKSGFISCDQEIMVCFSKKARCIARLIVQVIVHCE